MAGHAEARRLPFGGCQAAAKVSPSPSVLPRPLPTTARGRGVRSRNRVGKASTKQVGACGLILRHGAGDCRKRNVTYISLHLTLPAPDDASCVPSCPPLLVVCVATFCFAVFTSLLLVEVGVVVDDDDHSAALSVRLTAVRLIIFQLSRLAPPAANSLQTAEREIKL